MTGTEMTAEYVERLRKWVDDGERMGQFLGYDAKRLRAQIDKAEEGLKLVPPLPEEELHRQWRAKIAAREAREAEANDAAILAKSRFKTRRTAEVLPEAKEQQYEADMAAEGREEAMLDDNFAAWNVTYPAELRDGTPGLIPPTWGRVPVYQEGGASVEWPTAPGDDPLAGAPGEGRKNDAGKVPHDLLPIELVDGVARVLMFGAEKYERRNWEKGMRWGRCYAAAQRHLLAWWAGADRDDETGLSHLAHAACCIAFLMAYEERGIGDDDRHIVIPPQEK